MSESGSSVLPPLPSDDEEMAALEVMFPAPVHYRDLPSDYDTGTRNAIAIACLSDEIAQIEKRQSEEVKRISGRLRIAVEKGDVDAQRFEQQQLAHAQSVAERGVLERRRRIALFESVEPDTPALRFSSVLEQLGQEVTEPLSAVPRVSVKPVLEKFPKPGPKAGPGAKVSKKALVTAQAQARTQAQQPPPIEGVAYNTRSVLDLLGSIGAPPPAYRDEWSWFEDPFLLSERLAMRGE